MLFPAKTAREKRADLMAGLKSGRLLRFPGAASPLVAMEIERHGFDGVYISGAGLAAEMGLPDIGLTTLSEVAGRGRQIARVTALPAIIDADTGFGETMNAARTVEELEELGLAGCHLEDQVNPKRCGHLDNKVLVETRDMVRKVNAAAKAKRDGNFVVMARTDSRASEGLEAAIERARAYVGAGADAIFPEALQDESEFEAFRKAVDVPLLANITEWGKTPLLDAARLEALGFNIMICPVTLLRLAMKTIRDGLGVLARDGTQAGLLERMQTRKELYELLRYEDYASLDQSVFDFEI